MTSEKQKELQEWGATLTKEEDEILQRIIEVKGEQYVLSVLGHLTAQVVYVRSL